MLPIVIQDCRKRGRHRPRTLETLGGFPISFRGYFRENLKIQTGLGKLAKDA
jgi:hypothetical protein